MARRTGSHRRGRASRRAANHALAAEHGEVGTLDVPEHPLVPAAEAELVTDEEGLAQCVEAVRAAGVFAFDTEFIGEETYDPVICLVQVGTADRVFLVDPIVGIDPAPIYALVADPDIRTIVHAGQQDLDPVARLLGRAPRSVVDTQILAGFTGRPYPLSLRELAETFLDVRLGKAFTFTRWDARPLARTHLRYAADDVRYLLAIHAALERELDDTARAAWAAAECAALADMERYRADPEARVRKLVSGRSLPGRTIAAVRALVPWRDAAAREADLPPRSFMKDEILMRIAKDMPKRVEQLEVIKGLPRPVVARHGAALLDLVRAVMAIPPAELPRNAALDERGPQRFRIDAAWSLVQAWCHANLVDPSLVSSRREIALWWFRRFEGAAIDPLAIDAGWRRDLLAPVLESLPEGRALRFGWRDGGPEVADDDA